MFGLASAILVHSTLIFLTCWGSFWCLQCSFSTLLLYISPVFLSLLFTRREQWYFSALLHTFDLPGRRRRVLSSFSTRGFAIETLFNVLMTRREREKEHENDRRTFFHCFAADLDLSFFSISILSSILRKHTRKTTFVGFDHLIYWSNRVWIWTFFFIPFKFNTHPKTLRSWIDS